MIFGSRLPALVAGCLHAGFPAVHGSPALAAPLLAPEPTPEGAASARPKRKAVILPLEIDGELSPADAEALRAKLLEGLRRGSFEVDAAASDQAGRCDDAGCLRALARAHGATHVVRARVRVVERDYDVDVALFDGETGATVATTREDCEICGITEAGNLIDAAAATLRTKLDALSRGPAMLVVESRPKGAQVRIDGELVGTTPLERPVPAGKHVVRIGLDGYIAVEREVTFVEGVADTQAFALERVPSSLPTRPWGWVSLGFGIAGVGAAVGFAVLRDRPYALGSACEGSNRDPQGNCRRVWNTEYHVLGFSLAGAALVTLGIAILVDSRSARKHREARRFTWTPAGLGVAGRF